MSPKDEDVILMGLKNDTAFCNPSVKLTTVDDIDRYNTPLMGGGWGTHPTVHDQLNNL